MKKNYSILLVALLQIAGFISAQETGQMREYNRSSLATMMVFHSEDEFGQDIYQAFDSIPTPDKYDDHNFGVRVIYNDSVTGVLRKNKNGLIKAEYGKSLSSNDVLKNGLAIEGMLNNSHCAKSVVAKWFNLHEIAPGEYVFDMSLIQERGQYNANEIDVALAQQSARGLALLSDAGEELLNNTFILVNDMTYVTAEEKAAAAKVGLSIVGGLMDAFLGGNTGSQLAEVGGAIADSFTGFTVKTHSYLYQLQWNDSVAAVFYNNYYTSVPNRQKTEAFLRDNDLFKFKYVEHEYEFDAKSVLKGKYDRNDLVKIVCTRSMDKNIAALQLKYEDFKVKTPIYDVIANQKGNIVGYTAKIGLKEGITEKSKFQVIQRVIDPETQKTSYKYVATLQPEKGKIWDNRYMAFNEQETGSELIATQFRKVSGGEVLPGMLIIEGSYRKVK